MIWESWNIDNIIDRLRASWRERCRIIPSAQTDVTLAIIHETKVLLRFEILQVTFLFDIPN